jgi:intracellular sulfur oxidation DsrE/DsrF family protein
MVFDTHTLGAGLPLVRVAAFLDACEHDYGASATDVRPVITMHAPAYIGLNDAAWARYTIGPRDPATKQPYGRNIFASERPDDPYATIAVPVLQRRGAIFLFCNNVLKSLVSSYARRLNQPADAVRADLIASFLPGVVLVPAAVAATAMAQERGCAYTVIR